MKPAARVSDLHVCPMANGPVPHVGGPILPPGYVKTLIAGLPAARVGDKAVCTGPPDVIVMGAATTMIGGLPAARMGDQTAHGGVIALGCVTVLIGDGSSAGGPGVAAAAASLQGMAMKSAKAGKKAFCEECAKLEQQKKQQASKGAQADTLRAGRQNRMPFCEECAKS